MGETYAEYVWPAWLISALGLGLLIVISLRAYRSQTRALENAERQAGRSAPSAEEETNAGAGPP